MTPAPEFVVEFGKTGRTPDADGRLDAPAFHRNHEAIWSALASDIETMTGDILEVGSGTGQHIVEFSRNAPHLTWWPSDINDKHLASIEAWRRFAALPNLREAACIDLAKPDWTWRGATPARPLAALLCANVIHISPWIVAENLFAGAHRHLAADGRLYLYGPFMEGGEHTAPSNAVFDASLRAQNPDWGVRDINDLSALADRHGMALTAKRPMPANNLVLIFTRR